jgi:hypothetical protein
MNRFIGAAVAAIALLGVVRSSQAYPVYLAELTGPNENPSNSSPGIGFTAVTIVGDSMRVQITFAGLEAGTTASHIHAAAVPPNNAGVATQVPYFPGFPIGVTSGIYDNTFDLTLASSYNPVFVTANGGTVAGAEAALLAALAAGEAYLNIHTTMFPGGEIRGFLTPVPEPSILVLAGFAGAGVLVCRRVRMRKGRGGI